ncbi:unnamed protein product, partial [marine sediment metagenome]
MSTDTEPQTPDTNDDKNTDNQATKNKEIVSFEDKLPNILPILPIA